MYLLALKAAYEMASYSLLLIFSGFEYDTRYGIIGFNPIGIESGIQDYKIFWSFQ